MASQTILVVDKDSAVRKVLREMFTQQGYEVIEASDGVQALQIFKLAKVDLLVTEIEIPTMDGIELRRRIATAFPRVPVLLMSSRDSWHTSMTMDKIIEKPFKVSAVRKRVAHLLSESMSHNSE